MPTIREQTLTALTALLAAELPHVDVVRNADETAKIGPGGRVAVQDGDPGEPEVYLGQVPIYGFAHEAEIVAQVGQAAAPARDAALDALLVEIEAAIAAHPDLSGLVETIDLEPPEIETIDVQGGHAFKSARLRAIINYTTTNRIG